jgi:5-epi-alpha-selinene synthase
MSQIVIPEIYCPFPAQINPNLALCEKQTLEWGKTFRLLKSEASLKFYHDMACPLYTCMCHPRADLEELLLISNWYLLCTLYDDHFDDGEIGEKLDDMRLVHEHLLAVIQLNPSLPPQGPAAEAFVDTYQRARRLASPTWLQRWVLHHAEFFAGQRMEAESRTHKRIPTVQEGIANRRSTYATATLLDFIELAGHIEIPPEIYTSQSFQAPYQAAQNIIGWSNDILSIEKEAARGDVNNMVGILQHERGCSLQEAVNELCAMISAETRRFEHLVQDFPSSSAAIDRDIRTYMVDLGSWIRGNLDLHLITVRYENYPKPGTAHVYLEDILPAAHL